MFFKLECYLIKFKFTNAPLGDWKENTKKPVDNQYVNISLIPCNRIYWKAGRDILNICSTTEQIWIPFHIMFVILNTYHNCFRHANVSR